MASKQGLKALGKSRAKFQGLETFASPVGLEWVTMTSDEVVAVCPVTAQPDWYTVGISYQPLRRCIESKSFKLYVQSFKNTGLFCEDFASRVAHDCSRALGDVRVHCRVNQKSRGGVVIHASATRGKL